MSDITQSLDYLPYVDTQPSDDELAAASQLIASELPPDNGRPLHESILTTFEPQFSPVITVAHESIASTGAARPADTGIDLTRYEEPSAPDPLRSTRDSWQSALRQAYVSHSYLAQRQLNLSLLERYGKNAWLIANSQVESELKALEQEFAHVNTLADQSNEDRKRNQNRVKAELEGLQETWRAGVGRALETEVAAEGLRKDILEKRRAGT